MSEPVTEVRARKEAFSFVEMREMFQFSESTIKRMVKDGRLKRAPGHINRITRQSIEQLYRDSGSIGPNENLPDDFGIDIVVSVEEQENE